MTRPASFLCLVIVGLMMIGDVGSAVSATAEPQTRLEQLGAQEHALVQAYGRNRASLSQLLSIFVMYRRSPPPPILVSPSDARDAVRAAILVRAMMPYLQRRAQGLALQARSINALRRAALTADPASLLDGTEHPALRGPIDPMTTKLRRIDDGLITSMVDRAPPLSLVPPLSGTIVRRYNDPLPGGGKAGGLTIRAHDGANVVSPASGTVEFVGEVNGWGVVLILRAANVYHVVVAGLDESNAQVGQSVIAGDRIGKLGSGDARDLYLEVRNSDTRLNPARWLSGNSVSQRVGQLRSVRDRGLTDAVRRP